MVGWAGSAVSPYFGLQHTIAPDVCLWAFEEESQRGSPHSGPSQRRCGVPADRPIRQSAWHGTGPDGAAPWGLEGEAKPQHLM